MGFTRGFNRGDSPLAPSPELATILDTHRPVSGSTDRVNAKIGRRDIGTHERRRRQQWIFTCALYRHGSSQIHSLNHNPSHHP